MDTSLQEAVALGLLKAATRQRTRRGRSVRTCVHPSVTPGAASHQAPLFTGLFRQECWNGFPFPPPGDLPHPGIEPGSLSLQADSLPTELSGTPEMRGLAVRGGSPEGWRAPDFRGSSGTPSAVAHSRDGSWGGNGGPGSLASPWSPVLRVACLVLGGPRPLKGVEKPVLRFTPLAASTPGSPFSPCLEMGCCVLRSSPGARLGGTQKPLGPFGGWEWGRFLSLPRRGPAEVVE